MSSKNSQSSPVAEASTRVAFVSLGCAKNIVDSEKMLGQLAESGCVITADESQADVMVINTCGFLEASRIEADEVIAEAVEAKNSGSLKRVVVAGCLVQRDGTALADRIPGIDAIVGVNNRDDIVRAVAGADARRNRVEPDVFLSAYHPFTQIDTVRMRITPSHYAYLRISEGCNQKCTFCTIPSIRGPMHCKPPEMVEYEAKELIGDGVFEISLIGQDTTSYGLGDDGVTTGLADLIRRLNAIDGMGWLRLMYVYPSVLTDDMLDAIAESEQVCKYIDIPLQHINDRILKAMHRRIDRKDTERLLERIRDRIPGVAVRTTMIAGFPGETDAEFEELLRFVESYKFDALGVFPYSLEPETPAGRMANQLPQEVKEQRVHTLMEAQQAVAFSLADASIGQRFDVLVDVVSGDGSVVGRHQGQAPAVDSVTIVEDCDASPGEVISVRCHDRDGYDLVATPTGKTLPVLTL